MVQQSSRILLVFNPFSIKQPVTLLSFIIRVVTCSKWNHAAILQGGYVHEMTGTSFRWLIKKLLGMKVSYAPNEGSGYTVTKWDKWYSKTGRTVAQFKPKVPVKIPYLQEGYGFLDLIQILLHLIRTRWQGKAESWDGVRGTRLWKGTFCSELAGIALGCKDAHLLTPADLAFLPELEYEREYETFKS
jgi:hypothetical protein